MVYIPPLTPWARARQKKAQTLFNACQTAARQVDLYEKLSVPDTVDGRFDLLSLFVGLMINRLSAEGREGRKLSQSLFDVTFLNLELACRELGLGDLSVPRHMKRMMAGLNGRAQAYANEVITEAVRRNIYGTLDNVDINLVTAMTNYIQQCKDDLKQKTFNAIVNEQYAWPIFCADVGDINANKNTYKNDERHEDETIITTRCA